MKKNPIKRNSIQTQRRREKRLRRHSSLLTCESLERNVNNGFDPQDEWRPNHELKSDQNEKREISHKRNHLIVSVPMTNKMRVKMRNILYWWNQWRIQWKRREKQEKELDKDKEWIGHRKVTKHQEKNNTIYIKI
jgi:hypothetical protein